MTRKIYAIIGDPIDQVRSPAVFNRMFAERDIDAEMIALQVRPDGLRTVLDGLAAIENFSGAIITIPHKPAAAMLASHRSVSVRVAGVANALKPSRDGWQADLFDGAGFVAGLTRAGHPASIAASPSAAIVGAGGAGLAIAVALLDAGTRCVALDDINTERANTAVRQLAVHYPDRVLRRAPGATDALVVNASSAGMRNDDPLPIDIDLLMPQALVADAIMKPARTRLLDEAARRGHPTQEGRHMLDAQAEALWHFFGLSPDA